MITRLLVGVATTIVLSYPVGAQDYVGTWSITPINYWCANSPRLAVDRMAISVVGSRVQVRLFPTFYGVLEGPVGSPNSISASAIVSVGSTAMCDQWYDIALSFPNPYQCTGTLTVDFDPQWHGLCPTCSLQVWTLVGQRTVTAAYDVIGSGCGSSLGETHLQPQSSPLLGTTFQVVLDNLPLGIAILAHGFSNTTSALGPLPVSLDNLGMPGCTAYTSFDVTEFLAGTGNTATWSLALPPVPSLLGATLYQQAIVPAQGANALGLVMSEARVLVLGNI